MQVDSKFVLPDTRIERVLNNIKSSDNELISSDKEMAVFGITNIKDANSVYVNLNSLTAFGNNWNISSYSSLEAKIYIERGGFINKIILSKWQKQKERLTKR